MLSPVKDCAKLASRYLTLYLGSISLPLYSIVKFDLDLSLGLEQNKKDSVLPKCNDNSCYQSATYKRSEALFEVI